MVINLAKILISRGVSAFGTLFLTLLVPIYLDIEQSSKFFTEFALMYFASIIFGLGIKTVILKSRAKSFYAAEKKVMAFDYLTILFPLIFLALLIISLGYNPSKYWFYYSAPILSSIGILTSYLRASGLEVWSAITEPGSISLIIALLILLCILFNYDLRNIGTIYFLTSLFYLFINVFILIIIFGIDLTKGTAGYTSLSNKETLYFLLIDLISYTTQWLPLFFLNQWQGKYVVYYTLANRLATIVSFISITIDAYGAPRFSNLWLNKEIDTLINFRNTINTLSKISGILTYIALLVVSYIFMSVQEFGLDFYLYCIVFITGASIALSLGPNACLLLMTKSEGYILKVSIIMLLIVIVSSTIFHTLGLPALMALSASIPVIIRALYYKKTADEKLQSAMLKTSL